MAEQLTSYDFTKEGHRKIVLMEMIRGMQKGSGTSFYHMAENFQREVRSALQVVRDESNTP